MNHHLSAGKDLTFDVLKKECDVCSPREIQKVLSVHPLVQCDEKTNKYSFTGPFVSLRILNSSITTPFMTAVRFRLHSHVLLLENNCSFL
jgi:hypothetical protein